MIFIALILYVIGMVCSVATQVIYTENKESMHTFICGLASILWPLFVFLSVIGYAGRKIVEKI